MALTTHTVTLHTEFLDHTPIEGTWTLVILTTGKMLLDEDNNTILSGDLVKTTTTGDALYTLPAIPQVGVLPGDASYRLIFEPSSPNADRIVSNPFTLETDKTLNDILTLSGEPITLSILQQAIAAQVAAEAAAAEAAASVEEIIALLDGFGASVISEDPDDPGTYLIGVVTP